MATISVGEVEAAIRLRDAVSPTVQAVSKALQGGVGVTLQWSASQQRAAMAMAGAHAEALKLNSAYAATVTSTTTLGQSMGTSTSKAGAFASSVGNVSTTLARSAGVFGLNAQALRAMDDAADIAELGLNNLSKTTAGFNAASLGVAGAGLAVGTAIGSWLNTFPAVRKVVDDATRSLYDFLQANKLWGETSRDAGAGAMQGLKTFSAQQAAANQKAIAAQVDAMKAAGATTEQIEKLLKSHKKIPPEVELQVKGLKEADKAASAYADKIKGLALQYAEINREAAAFFASTEGKQLAGEGAGLLASQTTAASDAARDAADGFGSVKVSAEAAAKAAEGYAAAVHDGEIGLGRMVTGAVDAAKASTSLGDSLRGALSRLPETILGALQGGGDLGKSVGGLFGGSIFGEGSGLVKSLTGGLTGVLGKTIGGALGSVIPGLGTLLGGLVGGLFDKLGGLFGGGEISKVNDLRDEFFGLHGGFVEVQKDLVGLTSQDLVKKIFDAKTVQEFSAAVSAVNSLLGSQKEAQEALQAAVDKYGFSIEELGPKFQAQKLNELATSLFKDFSLLTASGIEVGTVLEKMGPDLISLVDQARATGQSPYEAMRPMIDALIASGQLLDENGVAFTSAEAAGLTFAKSLEEGLQGAIDAINRLVAALTGIPAVTIPVNVQGGAVPDFDTGGGRIPGHARGFYNPSLPADYTFRAHRGEEVKVTPAGGAGGTSFGGLIVSIIVQGATSPLETGKAVVEAIRDNLAGLRTELAYERAGK